MKIDDSKMKPLKGGRGKTGHVLYAPDELIVDREKVTRHGVTPCKK